ncbi:Lysophospholipase L1 [Verrucomicrobium sp. GAS474]|uniref:SGNH/GDSL hydrolase family protein n=1 Tax=Verrucomicrobium sp. GAS474 TaxID=1882831 RepID=UPI00087C817B|nr:SGNH/GDSL hydrolase family protein [Verrucomicrobium sp. GAS474]SDT92523.1 Lysophospholipase L1 [Verrucomicrobium sp. GAS474]
MLLAPRSKFLLIGDSVTDAERTRPVGEGLFNAYGKGYVANVEALLSATIPDHAIRVVNMGCGGHTVLDLKKRWQTDVLDLKPDWLSIAIGINDVWRQFDMPLITEAAVALETYAATLEELVVQTKPTLKGLILMTPYLIEPIKTDLMRARMDQYGAVVRDLAAKHGAVFVDLQAAFDDALTNRHSSSLAWDRIHPNAAGHMVIARALLKAIGYQW